MKKLVTASVLTLGLGMWGCSGTNSNGTTNSPVSTDSGHLERRRHHQCRRDQWRTVVLTQSGDAPGWPDGHVAQRQQHDASRGVERRIPDTGDLRQGRRQPMALGAASAPYHCSIHPEMIGSINQATSALLLGPSY